MNDKKTSVRTLTMLALLVAMSIVFSRVLSISTGFVRFNLGSLPVLLAAVVFGPGAGFAVGAVADIIGGVLAGYAINPLITLGAGAIGLVAGFAWQKLSSSPPTCGLQPACCWGILWAPWSSPRWRCACFTAIRGQRWRCASPTPSF